jgi:melibiose permease/lactose/raffinose/galactose permease
MSGFFIFASAFLMVFYTDIFGISPALTGMVFLIARLWDAVMDVAVGRFIDSRPASKNGKFKPWIVIGGIIGGILTVLIFTDFGLKGAGYVTSFVIIYLAWDLTYGANDIAYWSMLPSLTFDQKEREKTGSFAKICANIGMYSVVVGILPVTGALGGNKKAWFIFAVAVVILTWAFLCFTVFGVKENRTLEGVFAAPDRHRELP